MKVTESGTTFIEELKIDSKEKTETFHIPRHNSVDLSDIMHMFELNLTIHRFPLKGVCYVSPLTKDQPPPKKLGDDMRKASQKGSDDGSSTIQESTYRITKKVKDLQFWDQRIQSFCRGLDVYLVSSVDKDSLAIESQDEGNKIERRQANSPRKKCSGGTLNCRKKDTELKCYIVGVSCAYFMVCYLRQVTINGKTVLANKCDVHHQFDRVVCCKPVCKKNAG